MKAGAIKSRPKDSEPVSRIALMDGPLLAALLRWMTKGRYRKKSARLNANHHLPYLLCIPLYLLSIAISTSNCEQLPSSSGDAAA